MPTMTAERTTATSTMHIRVRDDVRALARRNADSIGIPLTSLINAFLVKLAYDGVVPFELSVPDGEPNDAVYEAFQELEAGKGTRVNSLDEMYKSMGIARE